MGKTFKVYNKEYIVIGEWANSTKELIHVIGVKLEDFGVSICEVEYTHFHDEYGYLKQKHSSFTSTDIHTVHEMVSNKNNSI